MIVLDSSAVVDYVARLEQREWVADRLGEDDVIHAPYLVDVEVVSALRKLALRRSVSPAEARMALDNFTTLAVARYPHVPLLSRIWELRGSLAASDATYVALAEALDAPLVTIDLRLARSRGHRARIVAP